MAFKDEPRRHIQEEGAPRPAHACNTSPELPTEPVPSLLCSASTPGASADPCSPLHSCSPFFSTPPPTSALFSQRESSGAREPRQGTLHQTHRVSEAGRAMWVPERGLVVLNVFTTRAAQPVELPPSRQAMLMEVTREAWLVALTVGDAFHAYSPSPCDLSLPWCFKCST